MRKIAQNCRRSAAQRLRSLAVDVAATRHRRCLLSRADQDGNRDAAAIDLRSPSGFLLRAQRGRLCSHLVMTSNTAKQARSS